MADEAQGPPGDGSRRSASSASRRRLRAVFAADIAGFSGRMSLNETSTVNLLNEIRIVGRRALKTYDGWLFGMAGDGLFATFESAVNAVQCALEVQAELATREDLKDMPLRIGIHLGEVLIDDDLPYGETLNIAARLEALADPGGILVSGTVMDAVSSRISATFADRGVPHLKNIPRRIATFAVTPPPARSSADETRVGFSSLDRTTRLDRNALREIILEQSQDRASEPFEEPNVEQISVDAIAAQTAAWTPGHDFIDDMTRALAVYVGPLAKVIMARELKTCQTSFDLITALEAHVPTEEERLAFRVRASHVNAAAGNGVHKS